MRFWTPAAVVFLIAGVLETMFLGLSLLGTAMGGAMSVASLTGELRHEEAFIGPIVLFFYGLWFFATAIAGPLHLVAGVTILSGRRSRRLLWAATVASLLPVVTVYCAPSSMAAGVFGLLALLEKPEPPPAA